jgi:hypothetical protein
MVSADIFQFAGVHYLLLVDEYSKWPCVEKMKYLTAASKHKTKNDRIITMRAEKNPDLT